MKNYTKEEILALAEEMNAEYHKAVYVPHYYKRNGKMIRRQGDDIIETERYKFLAFSDESPLNNAKIFKLSSNGKMVAYNDLEAWACDFEKDFYLTSEEWEENMGEDV